MDEDAFRRCPLPLGWQAESRDAMSALADEVSSQRDAFLSAPWSILGLLGRAAALVTMLSQLQDAAVVGFEKTPERSNCATRSVEERSTAERNTMATRGVCQLSIGWGWNGAIANRYITQYGTLSYST